MQDILGLILLGIAGCLASGYGGGYGGGHNFLSGSHAFNGHYGGKCGNDGFYFRDTSSFVICSNNNAYVQPCAPGTKNSGYDKYTHGGAYHYRDFCDVNLVDYGYGARFGHKGGYGGGHSFGGYGGHHGGGYGGHHGGHGGHGGYGGHDKGHGYGGHSGYGGQSHGKGYQQKSYGKEYGYEKGYGHQGKQYGHADKHYSHGGGHH